MKKIISFVLVLLMIFPLIACGKVDNTPSGIVTEFLKEIKAGEISEDIYSGTSIDSLISESGYNTEEAYNDLLTKAMSGFKYEVISEEINNDTAVVKVKITNYNIGEPLAEVLADSLMELIVMAFSGASEDEITAYMEEQMAGKFDNIQMDFEKEVSIELEKSGDSWKVKELADNLDFVDALTGGFITAFTNMFSSFID